MSAYRNAPLRHRILKGYVIAADDVDEIHRKLQRSFVASSPSGDDFPRVYLKANRPGCLWIDTGPVWVSEPAQRSAVVDGLAESVSAAAERVRQAGGTMLPSGVSWGAAPHRLLCEDGHAIEVADDLQREILSNLIRRYVPELIALSGRALFVAGRVTGRGSLRLAESKDQVSTRYIASASVRHLRRVEQALRRDDRVSGFAVMDVNPVGDGELGIPNVSLRCLDAQVFPSSAVAQAVLLQALAVRARMMGREGGRMSAPRQQMLDRNRANAIAKGMGGEFEHEADERRRTREREQGTVRRSAAESVADLLEDLSAELYAMQIEPREILPLLSAPALASLHPEYAQTENDLLAAWGRKHRLGSSEFAALLRDRAALADDQVTRHNRQVAPGSLGTLEAAWRTRLAAQRSRHPAANGRRAPVRPARQRRPDEEIIREFDELTEQRDMDDRLRVLLSGRPPRNLAPALSRLGRGKEIRRVLRQPNATVLVLGGPAEIGDGVPDELSSLLSDNGRACVRLDVPEDERRSAVDALLGLARRLPKGVCAGLITNQTYARKTDRRANVEMIILDSDGGAQA
ncbi:hypothetical protein U3653_06425 [Nocardia sp. CDC186]|uniref:Uncharacterized protein n=1 Tax=Nocardia implantans TaxID=3108168 RepID=A0ABU6AQK4_9NOCA|nr:MULTISPECIES: hypothetical protein [unclassified Nocardia]MEB3509647.1 hypothetical protein [Nocardia sp. CDC186]